MSLTTQPIGWLHSNLAISVDPSGEFSTPSPETISMRDCFRSCQFQCQLRHRPPLSGQLHVGKTGRREAGSRCPLEVYRLGCAFVACAAADRAVLSGGVSTGTGTYYSISTNHCTDQIQLRVVCTTAVDLATIDSSTVQLCYCTSYGTSARLRLYQYQYRTAVQTL
eukprot:COSAG01_NODE_15186_length_1363_cov_77.309335_1_plen_166_part_00